MFFFVFFSIVNSFVIQYNNLVPVSGGVYVPLFEDKNLVKEICVQDFFFDAYPVSNIEYRKFIKNSVKWHKSKVKSVFSDANYLKHWDLDYFKFIQNSPVVNVPWYSCNIYCKTMNKRLPIIDEWEYIAYKSCKENNDKYMQEILSWYTKPVDFFLISKDSMNKNYYDIYGMNGIWEWVQDFNSIVIIGSDSEGGNLEQVLFCGTASVNSVDPADYVSFMRYAFRSSLQAKYSISSLGFRCVKDNV